MSRLTVNVLQYSSTGFNTVVLFSSWSWARQMWPSRLVLALWDFLDIHKIPSKPHITTYSKSAENSRKYKKFTKLQFCFWKGGEYSLRCYWSP